MGMTDLKYRTLVEALKRGILDGKYGIDAPFPSERALIRRFGLSRNTVQHALAELERAGFVSRQQGRGPFRRCGGKSGWVQRPFPFPREGGVCYPLES